MPVRNLSAKSFSYDDRMMVEKVVDEWQHPSDDCSKPIIVLENGDPNGPTHVYVLWDEWEGIPQLERSEIVMDACEQQLGLERSGRITIAMGLTKQEAERMKIRYQ